MHKKLILFVSLLMVVTSQCATIEGEVSLKEGDPFDKISFVRTFGDTVKATTNWRVGDFFGKQTIFAGITVTNTGHKTVTCHYYVAFFDAKKKLIAAVGQDSFENGGLKPGEGAQLGSCLIKLPKGTYKQIKLYEAVIYDDEPEAGRSR